MPHYTTPAREAKASEASGGFGSPDSLASHFQLIFAKIFEKVVFSAFLLWQNFTKNGIYMYSMVKIEIC